MPSPPVGSRQQAFHVPTVEGLGGVVFVGRLENAISAKVKVYARAVEELVPVRGAGAVGNASPVKG